MVYKLYLTPKYYIKDDNMELNFGVPKIRQAKEEKYPATGVLILLPTAEGLGRKFELNKKAIELLDITNTNNQVSFSFSGDEIYMVNTSDSGVKGLKVGKTNNGFSDKKHYEFIKKKFNLSESDELELFLEKTDNEYNGYKVFKLVKINNTVETVEPNLDHYGNPKQPCTNHAVEQEMNEVHEMPEYTQEQLDQLNSQNYAEEIEVVNETELYNENL